MKDNNTYGSVITEQGDLGFGITPVCESSEDEEKKEKES